MVIYIKCHTQHNNCTVQQKILKATTVSTYIYQSTLTFKNLLVT